MRVRLRRDGRATAGLYWLLVTRSRTTGEVKYFASNAGADVPVARLVRAQFRSLREADFVTAARSLGYSHLRIIFREMLPNALPPVIVYASIVMAVAILLESALVFKARLVAQYSSRSG